jgi:tRNA(Arg) A34 adenosine deaminase TadA
MSSTAIPSRSWPELRVALPDWVSAFVPRDDEAFATEAGRMDWVIRLAAENVRQGTGGPFAAAVFERGSGRLIAPGVNLVMPARWSGAHAEMVACALAQQILGSHDLGAVGLPACELLSSVEPCAMCLGAIPWTGVHRVVYGARDADARAVGFDEGYKPRDWQTLFRLDGIEIEGDVGRAAAIRVLQDYVRQGGALYNGRSSSRRLPGTA